MASDKSEFNLEQLALDYSKYLKIETSKDVKSIEENIDDMLTRLEEFSGIMNMMSVEVQKCADTCIPDLHRIRIQLMEFFRQIHMLEALVGRVHQDLNVVESQVMEAELDIGVSDGLFKNILKPFFSSKSTDRSRNEPTSSTTKKSQIVYIPPAIFKTSDFFPPQEEQPKS
ncbi:unnamed protein product [Bemisia tabaci]|uniref:Cappuccino n=1 Tax=Bemisia tabaci TaxID=7038 RepID=A0A9P0A528_BEMTA|nr:unnamed protein product [Bemisia tabaci]